MGKLLGVWHRVKQTARGEKRPTLVWIKNDSSTLELKLENELAERLFIEGKFPLPQSLRELSPEEDISGHPLGEDLLAFAKTEKIGRGAELSCHPSQIAEVLEEVEGGKLAVRYLRILAVPTEYEGMRAGDTVLTIRGGSGYLLAYALAKQAAKANARVLWTTPAVVKEERERRKMKKGSERKLLVKIYEERPENFHPLSAPELKHLELLAAFRRMRLIQRDRIAAGQRLLKLLQNQVLLGVFPEGRTLSSLLREKVEDPSYQELLKREKEAQEEVKRLYREHPAYEELMAGIDYMRDSYRIGPALLVAVGDPLNLVVEPDLDGVTDPAERRRLIRKARDQTAANFKALLGVHVLQGGKHGEKPPEEQFPRRRRGERANWSPEGRQALFLWTEVAWRRRKIDKDKRWCRRLEEIYLRLLAREERKDKEKRRTRGRIQKTARWRLASRFVEWWAPRLVRVMRKASQASSAPAPAEE